MKLILASASPRRAEVLRDARIAFEAVSTNIDESPRSNESPEELVIRLAEAKARSAAARLLPASGPAIVLGADTEVVADGPCEIGRASCRERVADRRDAGTQTM